jgi:hypothetical protein
LFLYLAKQQTIQGLHRDNIFPNVNKFNEAFCLIQASCLTGINEDNNLSMAIALHLGETNTWTTTSDLLITRSGPTTLHEKSSVLPPIWRIVLY